MLIFQLVIFKTALKYGSVINNQIIGTFVIILGNGREWSFNEIDTFSNFGNEIESALFHDRKFFTHFLLYDLP
jgi:hypothetical protein